MGVNASTAADFFQIPECCYRLRRFGQHLPHSPGGMIPLAERYGHVMREVFAALEMLRAAPSPAVEKSKPVKLSFPFGQRKETPPRAVNT